MNAIIAFLTAAILGTKKPIASSILGCAIIIALYFYFNKFELKHFFSSVWLGCVICIVLSFIFNYIRSGLKGGNHNTGPSFMAGAGGGRGGAPPGGIIQSDEEIQRNKK